VIVCLTLFYTFEGGMTAVIWTDVIQMFLYIAGAILSLVVHPPTHSGRLVACLAHSGAAGEVSGVRFPVRTHR
jgi:Na+/proline symporter